MENCKDSNYKSPKKTFFNLRSKKKGLGWLTEEEVEAMAKDLGVKPSEVREMEKRLSGTDMPFDPLAIQMTMRLLSLHLNT